MKLQSISVLALAVVGALGLAACGSDSTGSTAVETPTAAAAAGDQFNDDDVTFAQGMIPHHEQAIEMADIALDPNVGASDQVREIATRVKDGQDPQIEIMTGWLTAWGQPLQMEVAEGHDMSSMEGMMSAQEMDSLGAMTGADFDKTWMEMMIRHHEGAVATAQAVVDKGSNSDVIALAGQVILDQQGEIAEMQSLLAS